MLDDNFKNWLMKRKNMTRKSAWDVISRCRRVERVFGITLTSTVRNSKDANRLVQSIREEQTKFFDANTNVVFAYAVIARAIRLFAEYRESKQN